MIAIRRARTSASSRYCVVRNTVTPSFVREPRHLLPEVGSALGGRGPSSARRGRSPAAGARARARGRGASSCRPSTSPTRPPANSVRPTRAISSAERCFHWVLRQPLHRALEAHVLPRVEGAGRAPPPGARRRWRERTLAAWRRDVVAGNERRPARGREQGCQHVDGRRLAGAVRAEEAVDLAGVHDEVDAVDGAEAAGELPHEALHDDAVPPRRPPARSARSARPCGSARR